MNYINKIIKLEVDPPNKKENGDRGKGSKLTS